MSDPRRPSADDAPALRIVQLGFATTLQDEGRSGVGHLGVPHAGPVDRHAAALVNRLVGNVEGLEPAGPTTIETLGGLVVEAVCPVVVARSSDASRHTLAAGERLRIDAPEGQVWSYLAVRGGVATDAVLGSCSQDTLADVGPPPLAVGDRLRVGPDPGTELAADHAAVRRGSGALRLWDGPQHDWFIGGRQQLVGRPWTVSREVSRVGVRLVAGDFPRSARSVASMESIGLVEGAVQITPAGEPIVMLANHPTTGGYPVIAVVDPDDLPALVQTPPGRTVRFRRA